MKNLKEDIIDTDDILSILNEITEEDKTIKDLK